MLSHTCQSERNSWEVRTLLHLRTAQQLRCKAGVNVTLFLKVGENTLPPQRLPRKPCTAFWQRWVAFQKTRHHTGGSSFAQIWGKAIKVKKYMYLSNQQLGKSEKMLLSWHPLTMKHDEKGKYWVDGLTFSKVSFALPCHWNRCQHAYTLWALKWQANSFWRPNVPTNAALAIVCVRKGVFGCCGGAASE